MGRTPIDLARGNKDEARAKEFREIEALLQNGSRPAN
jgi:hypothetical protein